LVQDVLWIPLGQSESPEPGPYPRNGPVVVGALYVDRPVEAPFPLGQVVRDVGQEIRRLSIALHHHAVLVVAEPGGGQPERTIALVRQAGRSQIVDGLLDSTIRIQRGLEVEVVEPDAEVLEIAILLRAQLAHSEDAHGLERLVRLVAKEMIPV